MAYPFCELTYGGRGGWLQNNQRWQKIVNLYENISRSKTM